MKTTSYEITATRDGNGTRIWSRNAETLGEFFGKTLSTLAAAEQAKDNLEDGQDEAGMPDAEYEIVAVD